MNKQIEYCMLDYKSQLFDLIASESKVYVGDWLVCLARSFNLKEILCFSNINIAEIYPSVSKHNQDSIRIATLNDAVTEMFLGKKIILKETFHHDQQLASFDVAFQFQDPQSTLKLYVFLVLSEDYTEEFIYSKSFTVVTDKFLDHVYHQHIVQKNLEKLLDIKEQFHSTMNVKTVLQQVFAVCHKVYPRYRYSMSLTNDYTFNLEMPVSLFQFDTANEKAMDAFVTGRITAHTDRLNQLHQLYAPLKGKQGVYGILEIEVKMHQPFSNVEREFFQTLTHAAGAALENAKLYQQSQQLISDLQFINETSHTLNSCAQLKEIVRFLFVQVEKYFQVTGYALILMNGEDYKCVRESSTQFFCEKGKNALDLIVRIIKNGKKSIFSTNVKEDWHREDISFASLMAVPMIQGNELIGICIAVHEKECHFTFDAFKLYETLISHSTLALSNLLLRQELEKLVITDQLTQLYAKSHLYHVINQSMIGDQEGTFILLDIDNFKEVNDTFGHQIGDKILVQVSKIIKKSIRSTDIGARWGGEELAIYLPGCPIHVGVCVAKRLVAAVRDSTSPQITISCGVSYWNHQNDDQVHHLFNRADIALYAAKNGGKNRVEVNQTYQKL